MGDITPSAWDREFCNSYHFGVHMASQKQPNHTFFAGDRHIDAILASPNTGAKISSIAVKAQDEHSSHPRRQNDQKHLTSKLMDANVLIGGNVRNLQGEYLGSIKELVLNVQTGTIAYAVLSFGVRFSAPEKLFAIPWNFLKLDVDSKHFVLDIEKERFKDAPTFDWNNRSAMTDQPWIENIRSYYGT
jgi:sporulation protein YlmC with PRC-barrel domain